MKTFESEEMYLETILILQQKNAAVTLRLRPSRKANKNQAGGISRNEHL